MSVTARVAQRAERNVNGMRGMKIRERKMFHGSVLGRVGRRVGVISVGGSVGEVDVARKGCGSSGRSSRYVISSRAQLGWKSRESVRRMSI